MRNTIVALCLSLLACSCSKKDITPELAAASAVVDTLPAISFLNVNYGPSNQQVADVYLPAHRDLQTTRTLVMIHGGGWTAGDKADFKDYITEFQKELPEYALVNINYRLISYDNTYFPMEEQDIISAMQFLKNKSADYHISNDVILLGTSAGGHLALLQGYKHPDVIQTKGIISFYGPTDLADLFLHYNDKSIPWVLQKIMGGVLQENGEAFAEASPVNYVSAASPPTLIFQGDADPLVPVHQAYELQAKLDSFGVRNQLVVYPGKGHGWSGSVLDDSFKKIEAFVRQL